MSKSEADALRERVTKLEARLAAAEARIAALEARPVSILSPIFVQPQPCAPPPYPPPITCGQHDLTPGFVTGLQVLS